jgi:hypothetical protein
VLPRLLRAAEAELPRDARVYIGSYGVGRALSDQIVEAGYRYAPMFHLMPSSYWERRRLSNQEEQALPARSRSLAGPLPRIPELLRLPSARRVTWGVELGARFRDEMRAAIQAGVVVDTWQLDEIPAEVARRGRPRQWREFTRGVIRGSLFGRPALGDRPRQGLVWLAVTAFSLPRYRITPELSAFWRILNRASIGLLGEEYPDFAGDPRAAARVYSAGQRGLRQGGPVRRALGRKYVAGMTPGYHLLPGLRGNTHGLSRTEVNRWREGYVGARVAAGVSGFAEFDFRSGNNRARVMRDVLHTLARYL